jgi:hypothetical protein
MTTIHRFSPAMAKLYGLDSALVFAYLNWRIENIGNPTITLDELLKHYPYMGKWRLRAALYRLLSGYKDELPVFIRSQQRGMLHYTYRLASKHNADFNLPDDVSHGARYRFDVDMAIAHGVVPAIIHHNLCHWIVENWKKQDSLEEASKNASHYITARKWADRHHYLPTRVVQRGFKTLVEAKEIIIIGRKGGRLPIWTIPKQTLDRLLDVKAETYFPESDLEAEKREHGPANTFKDSDI